MCNSRTYRNSKNDKAAQESHAAKSERNCTPGVSEALLIWFIAPDNIFVFWVFLVFGGGLLWVFYIYEIMSSVY
jgi:hypothetical protein